MDAMDELLGIMVRLRDPERGCPWDRAQTFASIVPHTLEEAYEVADAIERGDMRDLPDELGDLLFQVVFYAQLASETGAFAFDDVAAGIAAKLIRRHPHVFGDAAVESAAAQSRDWEAYKAAERRARAAAENRVASTLDGVSLALPALSRAVKLQRRAARVGFDWPMAAPVLDKVQEELGELRAELARSADTDRVMEEFGDLLFACVNFARHLDIDPESALRHANAKFERRFRRLEALLTEQGVSSQESSLEAMDALWERVKVEEHAERRDPRSTERLK